MACFPLVGVRIEVEWRHGFFGLKSRAAAQKRKILHAEIKPGLEWVVVEYVVTSAVRLPLLTVAVGRSILICLTPSGCQLPGTGI